MRRNVRFTPESGHEPKTNNVDIHDAATAQRKAWDLDRWPHRRRAKTGPDVMDFPDDSAAMIDGCFGIFHISIATIGSFFVALTSTISTVPQTSAVHQFWLHNFEKSLHGHKQKALQTIQ